MKTREVYMKQVIRWLSLLAVPLFFSRSQALTDIAGIIETGNATVAVDSITWYLISSPVPILESTPGWEGDPGVLDTFQFQQKTEWPQWAELFYRVNGIPSRLTISPLLSDTWYDLPGLEFQSSRVRFEDTVLVGIKTPNNREAQFHRSLFPNPVSGNRLRLSYTGVESELAIELYSVAGRTVYSGTVSGAHPAVELTGIKPGVYLLRLRGKELDLCQRLVLVR
jgi:hypothetical protein